MEKRIIKRRISEAEFRCDLSKDHLKKGPYFGGNCDKILFSKSLSHDNNCFVDNHQFNYLYKGVTICKCFLKNIKYPGTLKLVSPSAIYSKDLVGSFKSSLVLPKVFSYKSKESSWEMVELYNMMLLRDVYFCDYDLDPNVELAVKDLNDISEKKLTTKKNLFRGNSDGDLLGPYVSQFLYLPFNQGPFNIDQKYHCYKENVNYMKTYQTLLSVQNGTVLESGPEKDIYRYLQTLRDGATYVHQDNPITSGNNAASILYSLGCPLSEGLKVKTETPFVDLGPGDIYDLIGRAARIALLTAWYYKWQNLRIRPEYFGMLINKIKESGKNEYDLYEKLLNSDTLSRVYSKNNNYLLHQCYPEGSPCHPAYPAGHATFAGATITIIKAFFDENYEIEAVKPSKDGQTLIKTGEKLKVGKELDKLASNISIFRNGAGVHYRSDALGIELGEQVAISILKEHIKRYPYKLYFSFHLRDGTHIKISNF